MNIVSDLKKIITLKENEVIQKINSFSKNINELTEDDVFIELCFCILVANNSIKNTEKVWKLINKNFLKLNKNSLAKKIKENGGRFYNKRAEYIVDARKNKKEIYERIKTSNFDELRFWLVKNIKGIGMKEASHFLRNLGYKNFAILDRHVLKILRRYKIIKEIPKSLSIKKYLEIEKKLEKLCKLLNIHQSELDLYLFYLDSGRICEK